MPTENQMLADRIEALQRSVEANQAETNKSLNRMAESITNLSNLMAEKAANDKHVEEKLESVKKAVNAHDNRLRKVEDYVISKQGMQKYLDFFWRAAITVVASSMVGGIAWAVAKSMGVI